MIAEGLTILLMGVGVVFAFLALLVGTLFVLAQAVAWWGRIRPAAVPAVVEELALHAAAVAVVLREKTRKES